MLAGAVKSADVQVAGVCSLHWEASVASLRIVPRGVLSLEYNGAFDRGEICQRE